MRALLFLRDGILRVVAKHTIYGRVTGWQAHCNTQQEAL